jgi:uncharacterized protein
VTLRVRVDNLDRDVVLGDQVGVADGWWSRCRGLLGRRELPAGHGLLLSPCGAIHMLGMAFPVDVAFLDRRRIVLALRHALRPGLRAATQRGAAYALELPSGTLRQTGTVPGDRLDWQPVAPALVTSTPGPRPGTIP